MAKTLIYTGANDFIVNKIIYIMEDYTALEKHTTTDRTVVTDIVNLCNQQSIDVIHLHGPVAIMKKLQQDIIKRNIKFKNQNIQFLIN